MLVSHNLLSLTGNAVIRHQDGVQDAIIFAALVVKYKSSESALTLTVTLPDLWMVRYSRT